jgi:hypothetical protein
MRVAEEPGGVQFVDRGMTGPKEVRRKHWQLSNIRSSASDVRFASIFEAVCLEGGEGPPGRGSF